MNKNSSFTANKTIIYRALCSLCRSCDSSFGLGVTNNDDELCWFTSDQIEGTEESLKMDFKFPCPEPSGLKNILMDHDSPELNNQKSSCISVSKDELNIKNQVSSFCFESNLDKHSLSPFE